jgi:hypothetical protein
MWYFVICFVPHGEKQRRYIKILMVPLKIEEIDIFSTTFTYVLSN